MKRTSFADMPCPIARALDAVGEWWSLLILREAFTGHRRFDEFQERLGIARNILASRLKALTAAGILEKRPLPEEGMRRVEYRLTDKGRALHPVLLALAEWGNEFGNCSVRVAVETADTAEPVALGLVNRQNGRAVDPGNIRIRQTAV